MKVVILDDDKAVRSMLAKICGEVLSDHEVVTFTDGTEAEHYMLENSDSIRYMICDQNHPGMLGEEIIKELVDQENLTMIFETADGDVAESVHDQFPTVHTLKKPYCRERLTTLLKSVAN